MTSLFRRLALWSVPCILLGVAMIPLVSRAEPAQPGRHASRPVRIGTYDSRAIAVAYAASDFNRQYIQQLMAQSRDAERTNDQPRLAAVRAEAEAAQRRLHRQGFSVAPVDDILVHVRDQLSGVCEKAGVVAIARSVDVAAPGVEIVDVTDELVRLFDPSPKTLQTIDELRRQKPVDLDEIDRLSATE